MRRELKRTRPHLNYMPQLCAPTRYILLFFKLLVNFGYKVESRAIPPPRQRIQLQWRLILLWRLARNGFNTATKKTVPSWFHMLKLHLPIGLASLKDLTWPLPSVPYVVNKIYGLPSKWFSMLYHDGLRSVNMDRGPVIERLSCRGLIRWPPEGAGTSSVCNNAGKAASSSDNHHDT